VTRRHPPARKVRALAGRRGGGPAGGWRAPHRPPAAQGERFERPGRTLAGDSR
jgi:hypothetical protein